MERLPPIDKQLRTALLRQMRERRHRSKAALSASERLEWLQELRKLTDAFRTRRAIEKSRRDEPVELWLRLQKKWRAAG